MASSSPSSPEVFSPRASSPDATSSSSLSSPPPSPRAPPSARAQVLAHGTTPLAPGSERGSSEPRPSSARPRGRERRTHDKKSRPHDAKAEGEEGEECHGDTTPQTKKKRKTRASERAPGPTAQSSKRTRKNSSNSDADAAGEEEQLPLSREDSFDLNDFMEDLDSTVDEHATTSTRGTPTKAAATTGVDDDFLLASAFAVAPVSSRLRSRSKGGATPTPTPAKPRPRAVKRRSAENKWSVSNLLADIIQNQDEDADADAEVENGHDDETLAYLRQETMLRQQRKQGTNDKFNRGARSLDVFPQWPLELLPIDPPQIDPDVLPSSMLDAGTWPVFLTSGECLRFINTTSDMPEALSRWLLHVAALETNERVVWAAAKALKATVNKRAETFNFWVASIRDFEDLMRWYGAGASSTTSLDSYETVPDASTDHFPLINFECILNYMSRAIAHRPSEYSRPDVLSMLRWVTVLLQDRRVGSRCYVALRECLCAIFGHPVFQKVETDFEELLNVLLVTGHDGHVPNKAVMLSLLPVSSSPLILELRKRMALALLEQHFGASTMLSHLQTTSGLDGGRGDQGDDVSISSLTALLANVEIESVTDYTLLSCMIDFIDFAVMGMSGSTLQSPAVHQLALALKSLNGRIREVQGFNLAVTRAKDKLVILAAKLEQFKRLKSAGSQGAPRADLDSFLQRDPSKEE